MNKKIIVKLNLHFVLIWHCLDNRLTTEVALSIQRWEFQQLKLFLSL